MKRITDKSFVYVPSNSTDIRKTFERIREEQKQEAANRLKQIIDIKRKGQR